MTDLSKVSTEDLLAYKQGRLGNVSTEGLMAMRGSSVSAPKQQVTKTSSFLSGLNDMASFGLDDELRGLGTAIGQKLRGNDMTISQGIESIRNQQKTAQEANPKTYLGGQVTGAVLPAIASGGRSVLSGLSNPIARASATGAIQGGLYGLGSGEKTLEDRLVKGGIGAGFGALGGAGITYGLSLLGRAGSKISNQLAGVLDKFKGTSAEPLETGTKKVIDKLRADFPDDQAFLKALSDLPQGASLAEIAPQGGKIQRLVRGAAQYPSGEKIVSETLENRTSGTGLRVKQGIKDYISPNTDFYGTVDKITQNGQIKAKPLYEKAYQETVNVDVSVPEINQAISKARSQYPSELKDLPDNSIKVLDYAKRVLDDDIGVAKRSGEGNFARSRSQIKNDLLSKIDQYSPTYAKARKLSGDYLSNTEALETGREFLKMDADTISKTFKTFNPTQKESFKAGVARGVRDIIDNSNDSVDITKKILGKEEIRNSLKSIMSPKEYDEFAKLVRAEAQLKQLERFTLGNSTTAGKAIDAESIAGDAQEIVQSLATNGPASVARQQVAKAIFKTFDGLSDKTSEQVAKALMETDRAKQISLIQNLKSLPKGQSQKALEAFFESNKAIQNIKKLNPSPEIIGKISGAVAGISAQD
jgi:hypothetical protein